MSARYLANRIVVSVGRVSSSERVATLHVDRHGHADVIPPGGVYGDGRMVKVLEDLEELGVIERRYVGPGEVEAFVVGRLLDDLRPALVALPLDWQEWTP